jgi:hypothetical protein
MPSTGQRAPVSGIYANDCHAKQIALSKGEIFPLLALPPRSQLASSGSFVKFVGYASRTLPV